MEDSFVSPETSPVLATSSRMGLFGKLPFELRTTVWEVTLISDYIVTAHTFIAPYKSILVNTNPPVGDIDAAILRTCRAIYHEALPLLYDSTLFLFRSVTEIENFRSCRLPRLDSTNLRMGCIFGFKAELHGRLVFLRRVYMSLDADHTAAPDDRDSFSCRKTPWPAWLNFFEPENKEDENLAFPALEELTLDFGHWTMLLGRDLGQIRVRSTSSLLLRKLTFSLYPG